MISIALIQLSTKHTEIIGGIVSMLLRKNINQIIIYTIKYQSSFVPYYQRLFKQIKKIKWVSTNKYTHEQLEKKIKKECNFYIYLTGPEYEDFKLNSNKTLLLYHHTDEIEENAIWNTCAQIALTPIFDQYNIKNFLNVFKGNCIKASSNKLEILIVGLTNPENKDLARLRRLMIILSKNNNKLQSGQTVLFHIINYYKIDKKFKPFEKNGLLKVYTNIPAIKMMKILRKSSYTMVLARKNSSYHTNQLSGIIPLSISCGVPLICDKRLAKIYGISRICITYTFTNNYLYRALKNAEGKNLKARVITFRNKKICENKKASIPCIKSAISKKHVM